MQHQIQQQNYFTTGYDWRGYAVDAEFTNMVISNSLQGEFEFFNFLKMDFSLSISSSKQNNPGDLRMDIRPGSGGTKGFESDVPDLITISPRTFLNSVTVLPEGKISTGTSTLERDIDETAQSALLNFQIPFAFSDFLSGYLKLGGKYIRNKRTMMKPYGLLILTEEGLQEILLHLLKDSLWTNLGYIRGDPYLPAGLFRDPNYDVGNFLSGNEGVSGNIFFNLVSFEKMHHMEELAKGSGYYLPAPLESSQYDYDYTRNFGCFLYYVGNEIW